MFLVELTPATLIYLTHLMDSPDVRVRAEDVMSHAAIRQQLASPTLTSTVAAQLRAEGAASVVAAPTE